MAGSRYTKLDDKSREHDPSLTEAQDQEQPPRRTHLSTYLSLALLLSLALNALLLHRNPFSPRPPHHFMNLDRTFHSRLMGYFCPTSPYTSHNATARDEAWAAVNVGQGLVAIDTTLAQSQGLPETRRWKPDRTKSVYLVAAYHALHCLPYIRATINTVRDGGAVLSEGQRAHLDHCLDVLRAEVMCTADDTLLTSPVYPLVDGQIPAPGMNQTRQCRNFEAIRDFTNANTACYLDVELNPGAKDYWNNCRDDGWII